MKHEFMLTMEELIQLAGKRIADTKLPDGEYTFSSSYAIQANAGNPEIRWIKLFFEEPKKELVIVHSSQALPNSELSHNL